MIDIIHLWELPPPSTLESWELPPSSYSFNIQKKKSGIDESHLALARHNSTLFERDGLIMSIRGSTSVEYGLRYKHQSCTKTFSVIQERK